MYVYFTPSNHLDVTFKTTSHTLGHVPSPRHQANHHHCTQRYSHSQDPTQQSPTAGCQCFLLLPDCFHSTTTRTHTARSNWSTDPGLLINWVFLYMYRLTYITNHSMRCLERQGKATQQKDKAVIFVNILHIIIYMYACVSWWLHGFQSLTNASQQITQITTQTKIPKYMYNRLDNGHGLDHCTCLFRR